MKASILVGLISVVLSPTHGYAQVSDHLKCYKMRDPVRVRGIVDLTTSQLGLESGCKIARARLYCVPSEKAVVSVSDGSTPLTPLPFSAAATRDDRICYRVKCPQPLQDTQVTDQFGTRLVGKLRTTMLCTPATEGNEYCGNGLLGPGEECDVSNDLACPGACQPGCNCPSTSGFPATGQTTSYTTGDDGDIEAGATLSYTDNGDGTVTDNTTGLMWEKKSDDGSLHDWDNSYVWTPGAGSIWEWVALVNVEGGTGFAGHSDWRVPNAKELLSIVDFGTSSEPYISSVFHTSCVPGCSVLTCSCTAFGPTHVYHTSTSDCCFLGSPTVADFGVYFHTGYCLATPIYKTGANHIRAVRGGLE